MEQEKLFDLEENEFELPVGFKDNEGRLHKTAKLGIMNGEVEERMSDPKVTKNGAKMITELLHGVTESIGTITNVSKDTIRSLSTIDRDYLVVKNRQVSMGDIINYIDRCPLCGGKNEVETDLRDLDVKYCRDEKDLQRTFELFHGVKNAKGDICKKITIQIPKGIVQEQITPIVEVNQAQATTALIQAIIVKIEGMDFINNIIIKKMSKKDRDLILTEFSKFDFGIAKSAKVCCANCGETYNSQIPINSLLGE